MAVFVVAGEKLKVNCESAKSRAQEGDVVSILERETDRWIDAVGSGAKL